MPHLSLFQCNLLCFDATSSLREENSKKTQATVRSLIVRLHLFWKNHRTLRCLSSCVFKLQHSTVRTERTIASKASHLDEKLLCVAVVHAVHCSGQQVDQLSLKGPSVRSEQRLLHSDPHTNPQMRNPQMMKIELSTKKAESPSPSCGKRHRSYDLRAAAGSTRGRALSHIPTLNKHKAARGGCCLSAEQSQALRASHRHTGQAVVPTDRWTRRLTSRRRPQSDKAMDPAISILSVLSLH